MRNRKMESRHVYVYHHRNSHRHHGNFDRIESHPYEKEKPKRNFVASGYIRFAPHVCLKCSASVQNKRHVEFRIACANDHVYVHSGRLLGRPFLGNKLINARNFGRSRPQLPPYS